jgi:hypothetical protein
MMRDAITRRDGAASELRRPYGEIATWKKYGGTAAAKQRTFG